MIITSKLDGLYDAIEIASNITPRSVQGERYLSRVRKQLWDKLHADAYADLGRRLKLKG